MHCRVVTERRRSNCDCQFDRPKRKNERRAATTIVLEPVNTAIVPAETDATRT